MPGEDGWAPRAIRSNSASIIERALAEHERAWAIIHAPLTHFPLPRQASSSYS